jgi:hypothetical protein
MIELMGCLAKFHDERSGYSVVFDDDGRVAYAYLLDQQGSIVGDVWLYNRCDTPLEPEWAEPSELPFANPFEYVKGVKDFAPVNDASEVKVEWNLSPNGLSSRIFIRGELFGVLIEGATPGWSVLAAKSGPLAKVMEGESCRTV